jgi:hypothetical protein
MTGIKAFVLCHPQSKDLLSKSAFQSNKVKHIRIACGTTRPKGADLYESNDFFPNYASLNSCLFETSVILTIWEHADQVIGNENVAIMHTDVTPHFKPSLTWNNINDILNNTSRPVGIAVSSSYQHAWDDWLAPDNAPFTPKKDPLSLHDFDVGINVWDIIKRYEPDAYHYAFDVNPKLIYSHQFACTRDTFDYLGFKLKSVVERLRLSDIGFWTPHVMERLIALFLAQRSEPVITTAFWHYYSSGSKGPGDLSLYGPRPFKYYQTGTRLRNATKD